MTAPVLHQVTEEADDLGGSLISLGREARISGLPLNDTYYRWIADSDAVAQVIIDAIAARLRANGRIFQLIDDERRYGIRMDLGGIVYYCLHQRDRFTGCQSYSSSDLAGSAA